jgi:hypothetical protein
VIASFTLAWLLIVGEATGHNAATQIGPFLSAEDCQRVSDSIVLKNYQRQCVQVRVLAK